MTDYTIMPMQAAHWPQVAEIYQQGLDSRLATFQTEVPEFADWDKGHLQQLRYVALNADQRVLGWVAVSAVSSRPVYRGVLEHSIYVGDHAKHQGIGKALMSHLIEQSEEQGIWTLMSSVFPENRASIRLHESLGFRKIGVREKIAQLDGKWRDTWMFERRSALR